MKYLITIVGPTAIGKTSLSIALAQHFNCDILSCDSRQFFKEMTIGTAVPNELELSSAKHHFIHNKSIFESYNVGDFEKEAISKLDELYKTNDFAILVGGSGLYVDAILKGFDDIPEINKSIRDTLMSELEINGIVYLQEKLKNLEDFIHANDQIDPLVKMAIIHYQFEAIHPFFDGNGRTGRIILLLYLKMTGLMDLPALYLSNYIIQYKDKYYIIIIIKY